MHTQATPKCSVVTNTVGITIDLPLRYHQYKGYRKQETERKRKINKGRKREREKGRKRRERERER
jgi:hypothetical protein